MSEAHATTVYVRILNEDVEVWRPVAAEHLGGDLYRLIEAAPNEEQWQFGKNDRPVRAPTADRWYRRGSAGRRLLEPRALRKGIADITRSAQWTRSRL